MKNQKFRLGTFAFAGMALTVTVLSFQVLTDRKAARKGDGKKLATSGTIKNNFVQDI